MANDKYIIEINNPSFNTIVFDLNGTITGRVSDHPNHIEFRNNYITEKIGSDSIKFLKDSTAHAFEITGLDIKEYYKYRNSNIDWTLFHVFSKDIYDLIQDLHANEYRLVLHTDCYKEQVDKTLEIIGLKNCFNVIISAENNFKKPSPAATMFILNRFKIEPNEILIVANDWEKDILPVKSQGGNLMWIKSEKYLVESFDELNRHHCQYQQNQFQQMFQYQILQASKPSLFQML